MMIGKSIKSISIHFLFALLLAGFALTQAQAQNVLLNPSLESNDGVSSFDHWRFYVGNPGDGTLEVISDAQDGSSAARFTRLGNTGDVVFDNWDSPSTVTEICDVTATLYLRDPNAAATGIEVHCFQMNESKGWIGDFGSYSTYLGMGWNQITLTGRTDPATAFIGLAIRITDADGVIDIDNLSIELTPVGIVEGNNVLDPSLESNDGASTFEAWRMYAAVDGEAELQVISDANTGSSAARLIKTGDTGDVVFDNWNTACEALGGFDYSAKVFLRDPASSSTQVTLNFFTYDSTFGNWIDWNHSETFTLTGQWAEYELPAAAIPLTARYIGIAVRIQGTGTVDIDDIDIYRQPYEVPSGNLLSNPGMELNDGASSINDWRLYASVQGEGELQAVTGSQAGSWAARISRTGTTGDVVFDNWDAAVRVDPAWGYMFDVYLRDPNSAGTQVEFHLFQYSSFYTWIGDTQSQTVTLTGEWIRYSIPLFSLSEDAHYAGVAFRIQGTGTVDIDTMMLRREGPTRARYFSLFE